MKHATALSLPSLRRPWAQLAGCVWLPRLVDKVRLHFAGTLPPDFQLPFCHPLATDGAFLAHFSLSKEALLDAVISSENDQALAAWFCSQPQGHKIRIQAWNALAPHLGKPGFPVQRGFERQLRLLHSNTPPDPRINNVFALLAWDENTWEAYLRHLPK